MSDLSEKLQAIDGVGKKTAKKAVKVMEDHGTPDAERHPLLQKAIDRANEDNQREAAMFLRRYDRAE